MRTQAETNRHRWAILGVAIVVVILSLVLKSAYYELVLTQVLLWAVLSLAWNVLSGYSGYFSFGHAVFWGLGAYTVALGLIYLNLTPWLTIPLSAVVGSCAGALIGYPTFRLRGHYFALAMLAYPLAILYVFQWLGYQELTLPMKREAAWVFMQFDNPRVYVVLALGLLVATLLISLKVENSRFGMALLAIKQNEPAAEAAGIDTWRWKMLALMLSGALGATAGGLYAVVLLVLTPETVFGMLVSAQALILALFGGVGSIWGPLIGAAVLVPLAEGLNAKLGNILPGIQGVVYGIAIILIILCAPEGVYWRILDRFTRNKPAPLAPPRPELAPVAMVPQSRPATGVDLLVLRAVSISFGGLRALDSVDLTVPEGGLYGIIGPNGAGKTTLFNVINGFLPPDSGTISFAGDPLVGLQPNQVCRRGIGRTFQVVRAFPRMTVLENVIVGAFVGAADQTIAERMALAALDRVGLSDRAQAIAGGLTTRELRLMELARALAPHPRMLLLDETLAGLGHDDLGGILGVIRQLRADGITVLIIEHTMQAMVRLVDHFDVLDHGRIIATGEPDAIVRDPNVIEAYLGKKWVERVASAANDASQGELHGFEEETLVSDDKKLTRRTVAKGLTLSFGALALPSVAITSARAQAKPVKIASIAPLSGPWARQGQLLRMGSDMAADDINRNGGIKSLGGAKIEVVYADAGDSTEKAKNAAQRLLSDNPDLVGGTGAWLSSFTLAVTEVTERASLPWLTLSYSDAITNRGFKFVFQTSPTADHQARETVPTALDLAQAATGKRPRTVGLIMDNTASPVSFAKPLRAGGFEKAGLKLVVDQVFTPPLSDATPLIEKVRSAKPDFLLLLTSAMPDCKLVLEKLDEFKLSHGKIPLVGNGAPFGSPELLKTIGAELLEGLLFSVANWPMKGQEDFIERFKKRTGEPFLTQDGLCGYGDVAILKAALEVAGAADRLKVADAIRAMNLTTGPAAACFPGPIKFDDKGRRVDVPMIFAQWQKGVPLTVFPTDLALAKPFWPSV